ncbi:MAG: alcohol dehydrogenase [Acidiferrobacteraceae bacterium]|nr:alcohol dehydrogenase [Acidiferrobacteraceae bacterium]
MTAAILTRFGGLDAITTRHDFPIPEIKAGEVLVEVGACGINNTDINTRAGWYNKSVRVGTTREGGEHGFLLDPRYEVASIDQRFQFPRIQGADVAGRIVEIGAGVDSNQLGQRVLIDPRIRDQAEPDNLDLTSYLGNGVDGGFANYCKVPAINALPIKSNCSNAELATFPCSSSTAELMLERSGVTESDTILITGASGGVGSALIQLARRRGARVIALTDRSKYTQVETLHPDHIVCRNSDTFESEIRDNAPNGELDVIADVVGGQYFTKWLELLKRGGRYVVSGAIGGPITELDLRTLYLKDLDMLGATAIPRSIFSNLVGYIENQEIRPLLACTFPLTELQLAQQMFLQKEHFGNIVIVP